MDSLRAFFDFLDKYWNTITRFLITCLVISLVAINVFMSLFKFIDDDEDSEAPPAPPIFIPPVARPVAPPVVLPGGGAGSTTPNLQPGCAPFRDGIRICTPK